MSLWQIISANAAAVGGALSRHVDECGRRSVFDWPGGTEDGQSEGDSKVEIPHDCFKVLLLLLIDTKLELKQKGLRVGGSRYSCQSRGPGKRPVSAA
ncbi:hypothetical protein SLS60_011983 [Paraconiothyrium brasiliense]|uniref:Uncharacterized protein n=1 Tax=Paraconiothyrium brasiliense TaxID=300254 RepID=A0ABR3QHQ3_9PLEO